MSTTTEEDFLAASHNLGQAVAALPEPEKAVVAKLYDDVKEFASQQQIKGIRLDA